jgi:hypothetical protein
VSQRWRLGDGLSSVYCSHAADPDVNDRLEPGFS